MDFDRNGEEIKREEEDRKYRAKCRINVWKNEMFEKDGESKRKENIIKILEQYYALWLEGIKVDKKEEGEIKEFIEELNNQNQDSANKYEKLIDNEEQKKYWEDEER